MAMGNSALGTPEQLKDPNYTPPLTSAVPLGIQHVLAMFVSNVTPAIIICGAAGFGFGSNSPDFPQMIYMIQMSMLFAGIATLLQTVGVGPVGARLPVVQGTSFAFLPIMIPLVAGKGVDAIAILMGGIIVGGVFHACLAPFIGRLRFALPPLITGLVVLMIGLALVKVGILYAAGGVPAKALLDTSTGIMRLRGTEKVLKLPSGMKVPVFPILHPAFLLRRPQEKSRAWRDLQMIEQRAGALGVSLPG